jgi:hypothetical protein
MRYALLSALAIASIYGAVLSSTAAQTASRVFVAAQGSDSNPCTFAQPCRSFQVAHNTVAAGGEVDVLDPADYGALTITKSISIQGHGFAGIAVASGDGITINAGASDKISLRGLLIDGVGTGTNGITFNSGGSLDLQNSLIRNFTGDGIAFLPTGSSTLIVSDTRVVACLAMSALQQKERLFDHLVGEADNRTNVACVIPSGVSTTFCVIRILRTVPLQTARSA